jgi:hypothetical protein
LFELEHRLQYCLRKQSRLQYRRENIKIKKMEATFKNFFTIYDPYTHQGLSNHCTLSPIKSGATVPLTRLNPSEEKTHHRIFLPAPVCCFHFLVVRPEHKINKRMGLTYAPPRITSTPRDDQQLPCTNQFSTFVYTVCNVTSVLPNKIQSILLLDSCINHILLCCLSLP